MPGIPNRNRHSNHYGAKSCWAILYLQDVDDADEEEEVLSAVVLGRDPAPDVAHRRRVVNLNVKRRSYSCAVIFLDGKGCKLQKIAINR